MIVIWAAFWVIAFGIITGYVASRKGRGPIRWGIFGASIFILAFPLVLIVSNRNRKCPYCAERVRREAVVCRHCHNNLGYA